MKNKTTVLKITFSLASILWVSGISGSLAWGAVASKGHLTTPQTNVANTMWAQARDSAQMSNKGGASIASLNTSIGENGEAVIAIKASDSIQYTAFKLLNPLRLVLDFSNMKKGQLSDSLSVHQGVVDNIRALYFQEANVLRMEVVLNQAADYDIQKVTSNQLTIHLNQAKTQLAQIQESDESTENSSETESGSAPNTDMAEQASIETTDPCDALLEGNKDKINLNFQGASLQNIFRIFSEISGFNLIIADGVSGRVNIRLYDVPWNRAFEILLENNRLGVRCIGDNIVRVATLDAMASEAAARTAAKRQAALEKIAAANSGELVTEVKRVNYGLITDVSANLGSLTSERGRVTVDARTNSLILTDVRANVDKMLDLIAILDVKTQQVMIKSRIVQVSKNFFQELGIQWGLTGNLDTHSGDLDGTATTPDTFLKQAEILSLGGQSSAAGLGQFLFNLGTTSTATSGIGFLASNVIGGSDLDLQLSALEATGRGRVLLAPKVTTMDKREAQISSGRTIPFETTSANGTSTSFVDAELSLTVTPHVTSDENIFMQIQATKNAADFSNQDSNGNPTITTNEARWEVIVQNGDTTVLGGIFENTRTEVEKKVPFLSDIPIQNMNDQDAVAELFIFVTPTIIKDR